jgi:hypothetical protein
VSAPLLPHCFLASRSPPTFSGGWLLFSSYCSPLLMEMAVSTHHSANSNPFAQQQWDNSGCLEWTAAKERIRNTERQRRRLPHEEQQQRPATNMQWILLARMPQMRSAIGREEQTHALRRRSTECHAPPWFCEEFGVGDDCRGHLLFYPSVGM